MAVTSAAHLEIVVGAQGLAYKLWDEEFRPLGEANNVVVACLLAEHGGDAGDDEEEAADSILVLAPCAYEGSRAGKRINVSALRQVRNAWDHVLEDTAYLRAEYLQRTGRDHLTIVDLWWFASCVAALPAFLYRRATNPYANEQIPVRVAATFKVIQGIWMTAERMLVHGIPAEHVASAEELVAFTEAHGVYLADGRACAGPDAMVREFVGTVVDGRGSRGDLLDVIVDLPAFWTYAETTAASSLVIRAVRVGSSPALAYLLTGGRTGLSPPAEREQLSAWSLAVLSSLQARTMDALGRGEEVRPFTAEDLRALLP